MSDDGVGGGRFAASPGDADQPPTGTEGGEPTGGGAASIGPHRPPGPLVRFTQRRRGSRGAGGGCGGRRNGRRSDVAYRVRLFPFWQRRFLIKFDRLQLGALFDR